MPSPNAANTLVDATAAGTSTVWAAGYQYSGGALSGLAIRATNG